MPVSARPNRLSSAPLNRAVILDLTQSSGTQIEKWVTVVLTWPRPSGQIQQHVAPPSGPPGTGSVIAPFPG